MPMGEDGEFEQGEDPMLEECPRDKTPRLWPLGEIWRHEAIRRDFCQRHDWECPPDCQYGTERQ